MKVIDTKNKKIKGSSDDISGGARGKDWEISINAGTTHGLQVPKHEASSGASEQKEKVFCDLVRIELNSSEHPSGHGGGTESYKNVEFNISPSCFSVNFGRKDCDIEITTKSTSGGNKQLKGVQGFQPKAVFCSTT